MTVKEQGKYRHDQSGGLVVFVLGAFAVWLGYLAYHSRQLGPLVPLIVVLTVVVLFSRLTVEVDDEFIEVRFGPGVIKKKWRLAEIQSCGRVRNRWWHGWGIHWIARKTWLFNISGGDAVELWMKDGNIFRIGTDEPQELCLLIQGKLSRSAAQKP